MADGVNRVGSSSLQPAFLRKGTLDADTDECRDNDPETQAEDPAAQQPGTLARTRSCLTAHRRTYADNTSPWTSGLQNSDAASLPWDRAALACRLSKRIHLSAQPLPGCSPFTTESAACPGHGVSGDAGTREATAGVADRRAQFGSHHVAFRSFLRELCKGRGPPLAPRGVGTGERVGMWQRSWQPQSRSLPESAEAAHPPTPGAGAPGAHLYPLTHHPVSA